jgi:hypothetical protein
MFPFDRDKNLSRQERIAIIEQARQFGMSDTEIITKTCKAWLAKKRIELVLEWGELMGYSPSQSLQLGRRAGLYQRASLPEEPK